MRRLFVSLIARATTDFVRFTINVLGEYFDDRSTKDRLFIKKPRGGLFDRLSQREKLGRAGAAFSALHSRKLVHRSVANLTQDDLVVIEHGKPEGSSFPVISFDSVTDQRHGLCSPQTASPFRLHQLARQINNFGVRLRSCRSGPLSSAAPR